MGGFFFFVVLTLETLEFTKDGLVIVILDDIEFESSYENKAIRSVYCRVAKNPSTIHLLINPPWVFSGLLG